MKVLQPTQVQASGHGAKAELCTSTGLESPAVLVVSQLKLSVKHLLLRRQMQRLLP